MFIKEIEIENILGCRSVHFRFNGVGAHRPPVYIVQSEPSCPLRRALSTAVQLICSARYATVQSLTELKGIQQGRVRLVLLIPKKIGEGSMLLNIPADSDFEDGNGDDFSPNTSECLTKRKRRRRMGRQYMRSAITSCMQNFLKVNAYRDFRFNAETIQYSIDNGPVRSCSPSSFHGKFLTNVEYMLPRLDQLKLGKTFNLNANWLKLFSTELNEKCNRNEYMNHLLEKFSHLFLKKNFSREHLLSKLTTSCLTENTAMSIIQRAYACKVFQDVRSIFEFITCSEYTIWFIVPYNGQFVDIKNVLTADMDLNNMKTYIQLQAKDFRKLHLWTEAEHEMQDLLLIAFQLALAFHCKQNLVILQRLDALKDHQTMQLAIAAYLQKYDNSCVNWTSKNYLQRIIDVCVKINVAAIIEYPGGLPLVPINAYTIKCFKESNGTGEWNMILAEENVEETDALEIFVACLEENLRHR